MKFSLLCGYISMVLFSIMLLPQLHKTITSKSVDDISICFLILILIGSILRGYYSYSINATPILINNICAGFTSIILIILYYKYKKKTVQKK